MSEQNKVELPELPEEEFICEPGIYGYSAQQMREYGSSAISAYIASQSPAPIPEQVAPKVDTEEFRVLLDKMWNAMGSMGAARARNAIFRHVERLLATQSAKQTEFSESDIPVDAPRAFAKRYSALLEENHALKAAAQSAKQGDQPDLQNAIMNIPCKRDDASFLNTASRLLYKEGHRDARHAAVELVMAAQASVEQAPVAQEVTLQAAKAELLDELQQAVSDFRKATYEFARGQDPDDHATMMAAQKRIFDIADQLAPTTSTVSASGALVATDDVWNEAMEVAAKICENRLDPSRSWTTSGASNWHATAIRALKRTAAQAATDKSED